MKELSRKTFLKGSGAVVAGLAVAPAASAATGNTPFASRTPADFVDIGDAKLTQVDTWIAITPQNRVVVTHGQPEFAGTPTGILMLASSRGDQFRIVQRHHAAIGQQSDVAMSGATRAVIGAAVERGDSPLNTIRCIASG